MVAAPAGSCCGSIPLILDMRLTFHDNALDVEIAKNVIDRKADAETFDASSGAVSLTSIMQTGGCVGDALRGQGTDPNQLKMTLNSDGTLGFSAPGWGSMKLPSCQSEEEQGLAAAPTGSCCGSVHA